MPPAPAGLLVVDKQPGITSHDVVARVRRLAGTRKVGHAGTLDPMATGVLVLGIGQGTRLLQYVSGTDKRYRARIRLGVATVSDDADGEVLAEHPTDRVGEDEVRTLLAEMVGEIAQVPSAVSAVKVEGRRAYARVRAGETVELAPRRVRIHELRVTRMELPLVDIEVHCSSGTYIRAIARDLGAGLGVGGHLTELRRTAVGSFEESQARTLAELERDWSMTPLAEAVARIFPVVRADEAQAREIAFGRPIALPGAEPGALTAVVSSGDDLLGLYLPGPERAKPEAVFVQPEDLPAR